MSKLITINGVRGFIDENGVAQLSLEDVCIGLGFTQFKDEIMYVRWDRVRQYLVDIYKFPTSGELTQLKLPEFIPENIFYRLAMKAKNETAEAFQAKVADEILPAIRKTGTYSTKSSPADGKYLMIAESLIAELKGIKSGQEDFKAEVKHDIDEFRTTIETQVYLTQPQSVALKKAVERRVRNLFPDDNDYAIQSKKMFSSIWRDLKDVHQVPSYREIPRIHFQNAMQYVENWQPIKLLKKTG
jgi:prophage antirepressor-like protein